MLMEMTAGFKDQTIPNTGSAALMQGFHTLYKGTEKKNTLKSFVGDNCICPSLWHEGTKLSLDITSTHLCNRCLC